MQHLNLGNVNKQAQYYDANTFYLLDQGNNTINFYPNA
jgi:hypothetical protein